MGKFMKFSLFVLVIQQSMLFGCAERAVTETSARAVWADEVTEKLDSVGLGLLAPYEIGDGSPVWFFYEPGWDTISVPSPEFLVEVDEVPMPPDHGFSAMDFCLVMTDCCDPGDTECCMDGGCCETWLSDQRCTPAEVAMHLCEPCGSSTCEPMFPDPGGVWSCAGPWHSGVFCGSVCSLLEMLECCGPCGCDTNGCGYSCDWDECPENDHPEWPYHAP